VIDDARDVERTEAVEKAEGDSTPTEATTEVHESATEAIEASPESTTDADYSVLQTFEITDALPETATEADDSVTEAVEVGADAAPAQTRRRRPRLPRMRVKVNQKVVSVVLVVLVLVSGGVASLVYFEQYRPDQQTDAGVARAVVSAATDGTEAVLSYSSDTLDQDFAAAKAHLAGEFLSYYKQFTAQVVAPAAKQKSLKTTAHVAGAAVSELHPDSAVVLVFVDQTTSIKDNPQPSLAVSSIVLSMNRINGNWLITKFTPM
jgi:Mce-associated membrane protein